MAEPFLASSVPPLKLVLLQRSPESGLVDIARSRTMNPTLWACEPTSIQCSTFVITLSSVSHHLIAVWHLYFAGVIFRSFLTFLLK